MQADVLRGYSLWGHAIGEGEVRLTSRYAASGTITRDEEFVEASGVLSLFDDAQNAEEAGLAWARASYANSCLSLSHALRRNPAATQVAR